METMEKETPKRFSKVIDGLVKAFFNETLAKGTCTACAVGNIIAYANNAKVYKPDTIKIFRCDIDNSSWMYLFITNNNIQKTFDSTNKDREDIIKDIIEKIETTGYSLKEMMKVEFAFEVNTKIRFNNYHNHTKEQIMQDQYSGLMAVVDVLCKIEGFAEQEVKQYKEMFSYVN